MHTYALGNIVMQIKNPNPETENKNWFEYNENPGNIVEDSVILKNLEKSEEQIKIYAADAYSSETGGFILKHSYDEQDAIGQWTKIEEKNIKLKPGEEKEIKFKIFIPKNVNPGSYAGGIIMEQDADDQSECLETTNCEGKIKIKTRIANRIYLNVSGELRPSIEWTNYSYLINSKNIILKYKFKNNGNVAFEPKATINIYNQFGTLIEKTEKTLGESMPGTTIEPSITITPETKLGIISVNSNIVYKNKYNFNKNLKPSAFSETKKITILIFPWEIVLITLMLAGSICCYIIIKKNYTEKLLKSSMEYEVLEGENILDIAEKFNVEWKTLAAINKLSAPYIVKEKTKIKIPRKDEPPN